MTSSRPQKRINGDGMDCDEIISHLPRVIKDKILTKLPIKDVVRTSILSTNWRYTWASIPEIVVKDDDVVPTVHRGTLVAELHFVKNVDLLLFNHSGPILKFNLSTNYHIPEALDRWILKLSRNGITKLTFLLNSESLSKYRIHSSFFRCNALQHVDLSRCLIELPCGFEGLKLLRYLKLNKSTISADDLKWLISSSPNLVNLSLEVQTEDDLIIFSRGLKILTVVGVFSDLQIDAPNLDVLIIGYDNDKNSPPRVKKLSQSLDSLLNIQQIHLLRFSVQYLMGEAVVEFSRTFGRLKVLTLCADLTDKKQSNFVFSLLQNAVKLKQLYLAVLFRSGSTCSSFWEERSNLGFALEHLLEVSIVKYKTSEPLLAFMKLILGSAPVLKKLILIERGPKEKDLMVFKRLLEFRRASADAEVVIE